MVQRVMWTLDPTSQVVAREILRRGPMSRAELSRRLRLSGPTVSRIAKPLLEAGLIVEDGPARLTRTGRPSLPLRFSDRLGRFCGIGVLEDALQVSVCTVSGEELHQRTFDVDSSDPAQTITTMVDAVAWARTQDPAIAAVGVSVPGIVEHLRYVRRSRRLGWSNIDLAGRLGAAVSLPVVINNDFHALTSAEHWFGYGLQHPSFLTVVIDAVVGAGLVVNDRLAQESDGRGGLIGHHLVLPGGPTCRDGHAGCADGLLTRRAMTEQFSLAFGREITYEQGLALADQQDPTARWVIDRAADGLGVLVGELGNLLGHQNVVVTGDGAGWVGVARDRFVGQLEKMHLRGTAEVHLAVREWLVTDWGRAAAIAAVRSCPFLDGPDDTHA
ncbi:ROK family transcriptional regulator [Propionibacteriaceae bacterium Y1685]